MIQYIQHGSGLKPQIDSPAMVHDVFSVRTMKFTRLFFAVAKTLPVLFFVLPDFRQLRFVGNVDHLRPKHLGEKIQNITKRKSGLGMGM